MLDDEARRALEQEAIALVNLSNSAPLALVAAKQPPAEAFRPHALLQQHKATLMARRDDRRAPHPHRVSASSSSASSSSAGSVGFRPPSGGPVALKPRLSMSVFVDADGKMSVTSGGVRSASPENSHPFAAYELSPVETATVKTEDSSASPTSTTTMNHHHADAHISMQSLLVNLKKRKPEDDPASTASAGPAPTKLPRFRDVFEPARPSVPTIRMQATPTVSYATGPASPPTATASAVQQQQEETEPLMVESSPFPPPPELKCKYRTGKCSNVRALKSCGDYHNLCNYHRLRANANQRKLDRKKKVQRGQPTTGSSSEATSPVAAASTLASLPSSFLLPRAAQSAGQRVESAPFLAYLVPPSSSTSPSKTC